jgi:hypothetical protein
MTLVTFVLVSTINIGLLLFLIRKRGWASSEGLCACYLLAVVITDNVEVLIRALFWPETLPLGPDDINLRIYPTIIHILGVGALLLGLSLADPRPRSMSRTLGPEEAPRLTHIGIALVFIGAVMFGFAISLFHVTGFSRTPDPHETVETVRGAFLYRGADISLLGFVLLFATLRGMQRGIVAVGVVLTPMLATFNKGGLEKSLLFAAVAYSVYQSKHFKRLFRRGSTWTIGVPTALLAVMLVAGVKAYYRAGTEDTSISDNFLTGLGAVRARYAADGLYRGYSQLTTYMRNGWAEHLDGRILVFTLTAWIPGYIYPNKPDHPTRNTGYLVYSDHHSFASDASAFTLVGLAYADFGVASAVGYLLVGGVVLGLIRRAANRVGGNLYWHVGYLFVSLFGICSAEAGILLILYVPMLAAGVMSLTWLIVHLIFPETRLRYRRRRTAGHYRGELMSFVPNPKQRRTEAIEHEGAIRGLGYLQEGSVGLPPSLPGQ